MVGLYVIQFRLIEDWTEYVNAWTNSLAFFTGAFLFTFGTAFLASYKPAFKPLSDGLKRAFWREMVPLVGILVFALCISGGAMIYEEVIFQLEALNDEVQKQVGNDKCYWNFSQIFKPASI